MYVCVDCCNVYVCVLIGGIVGFGGWLVLNVVYCGLIGWCVCLGSVYCI